jgi:hypothetical protein
MAQTVQISHSSQGTVRNGWAVLGLNLITLGIYGVYWTYTIHRELRDIGQAHGDQELGSLNPVMSTLSVTLGAFIIVPPFVTLWRLGGRILRAQELTGAQNRIGQLNTFLLVVPGAILWIPAIYWVFHVTNNQNAALIAGQGGAGAAAIEVAPSAPATDFMGNPAPAPTGMSSGDPLGG